MWSFENLYKKISVSPWMVMIFCLYVPLQFLSLLFYVTWPKQVANTFELKSPQPCDQSPVMDATTSGLGWKSCWRYTKPQEGHCPKMSGTLLFQTHSHPSVLFVGFFFSLCLGISTCGNSSLHVISNTYIMTTLKGGGAFSKFSPHPEASVLFLVFALCLCQSYEEEPKRR